MPGGERRILAGEVISSNHLWPDSLLNIPRSPRPIRPEQQEQKEYEDRFIRVFGWESPHILIGPSWAIPWQR